MQDQNFFSPTRGTLSFGEMIEDIGYELAGKPGATFKILVGTDSEDNGQAAKFVTAVVLWQVGHGARAFRTITLDPKLRGNEGFKIDGRVRKEAILTGTLAQEIRSALKDALGEVELLNRLEVHADVGPNGRTSKLMQEVIGMLKAYGFTDEFIRVKPEAFAASSVADRYI